jgi:hypothetical protein
MEPWAGGQYDCALHYIAQLTDVTRPRVSLQCLDAFFVDCFDAFA